MESIPQESLAPLAEVISRDAAGVFDSMTASWSPELDNLKADLRSEFIRAAQSATTQGKVYVISRN